MKVIKNMKKLKFWSRKKKKKKINFIENPPTTCHCCSQNHQFEPSAPPLPPYYEQASNYAVDVNYHTFAEFPTTTTSSEWQFTSTSQENDIAPEMKPLLTTLPASSTSSYQQYMVKTPVYGMPVVPTPRKERSAGVVGCVFNAGTYLIRCSCPCFRIKEAY